MKRGIYMQKLKQKLMATATGGALVLSSGVAYAALDEVVVTATKRATSELEVPMSLEAFTGDSIEAAGIRDFVDLAAFVPNFTVGEGQTNTSVSLRGQGSGTDRSFEQSVALFVDGVYAPRSRQYRSAFFDMERVEVLRGPQAVLYGVNATAGSISVVSRKNEPGDEVEVSLTGEYEFEYEGYGVGVTLGGGVGENAAIRIAGRYRDTGDGTTFNSFTGQDEDTTEELMLRATGVVDINENIRLTGQIGYTDIDEEGTFGELNNSPLVDTFQGLVDALGPVIGPAAFTGATGLDGTQIDDRLDWRRSVGSQGIYDVISPDDPFGFNMEQLSASLTLDWDIADHTLTTILGYTDMEYKVGQEVPFLPGNVFVGALHEEYEQFSAEVRLASPEDQTLSYILGVFYLDGELSNDSPASLGPVLNGSLGGAVETAIVQNIANNQENEVISPFFALTYNWTDNFRIIGGARYSHEDKSASRFEGERSGCFAGTDAAPVDGIFEGRAPFPCVLLTFLDESFDRTSENFMPEVVLQYDVNESSTAYFKVGTSAKSGGFATSGSIASLDSIEYDDEKAITYEAGYKSRFWDDRVEANLTAFYTEYDDLQVNTFQLIDDGMGGSTVATVINNAGKTIAKGVEAEVNIEATDWLTFGLSAAYLDSSFDQFEDAPCNSTEPVPDNPILGTCNRNGATTAFAPEWSGALRADLDYPISNGLRLTGGAAMAFSTDYFTEGSLEPTAVQDDYTRWDARIGLADADDRWYVNLVGKNLNEEVIISNSVYVAGFGNASYIQKPRTITLQAGFNF